MKGTKVIKIEVLLCSAIFVSMPPKKAAKGKAATPKRGRGKGRVTASKRKANDGDVEEESQAQVGLFSIRL